MRSSFAVGIGVGAGLWALSLLLLLAGPSRIVRAGDSDDDDIGVGAKFSPRAAAIFSGRCMACHTYGKGIKVGPDLKGVTGRRKREWLLKFIHGSSGVIKSGDPTATALFAQFKQQRMPDWVDLSDNQINDILDYIAIGGPDIKPADERDAATATSAETENGRKLFYGEMQTKYGAQACVNCHSVRGAGLRSGSLGPDLTGVYLLYQDLALTQFLRHTCFSWQIQTPQERYLTAKESFALKAFLRTSAMSTGRGSNAAGNLPPQKETWSDGK
jgi:mono/diheme cytochrome c family protein